MEPTNRVIFIFGRTLDPDLDYDRYVIGVLCWSVRVLFFDFYPGMHGTGVLMVGRLGGTCFAYFLFF